MIHYQQECPDDEGTIEQVRAHVTAHLSAVAASDDDPETNADDVRVFVRTHDIKPDTVIVVGYLDAEPDAPYLRDDFDAFAGIDPALMRAAGLHG